jgi:Polysaccharide biosynthesis/export protein
MKRGIMGSKVQRMASIRSGFKLAAAIFVSTCCLPALAQQSQPKRASDRAPSNQRQLPGPSELEKENLNYVAASAAQVKEVLLKDPGLMVELKRWVAKEASDNGQLVSETDLTDNAVFDRLVSDVMFRSVATRLVQRYGYLRPTINPDSELGKEQDLLLKERVRRQAQLEAQADAEALKPLKPETVQKKTVTCDSEDARDCAQEMPSRQERTTPSPEEIAPQRDMPPYYPNEGQPMNASPQIMQTRATNEGSFMNQSGDSIESLLTGSGPMKQQGDSKSSGMPSSDPLSSVLADQARQDALQNLETGSSPDMTAGSQAAKSDTTGQPYMRRRTKLAADRGLAPAMPVHRPNPYADIPSLYDLYVQAPAMDRPPQRFGSQVFRDGLRDSRSIPMDLPVGPDYVVGPGDSLTINLWGGISTKLVRVVDRQGRVTIPEAGPLLVSGRSLGDVQQAVQRAISSQ